MTKEQLRNWIEWIDEQKVITREEKLYWDRMTAMKIFRPKEVRSPFKKVLDEIDKKLPIQAN